MNNNSGTVYIVHHIDTEGPLWESIEELFDRLKIIFGIALAPTYENLEKLQQGLIEMPEDQKKELLGAVDPHTIGFKRNWGMIEEMLDRVMSPNYRNALPDSFGGSWIYNWHVMDHVGFAPENPRHRDIGYHNIYDFYNYLLKAKYADQDRIHWHFHPLSFYKQVHISATCYDNSMPVLHQIISRRLIDKSFFPVVNRAGFHTERIDSNFFLEQWIPFDCSNQSVEEDSNPKFQKDISNGRFGDWRGAPSDWSIYQPSIYDWRQKGNANRYIARILNMKARYRNINIAEIEKAFAKASIGENVYVGITNHDFREMSTEIDEVRDMLKTCSVKLPMVKFKYSESVEAFRKVIGFPEEEIKKNRLELKVILKGNILEVDTLTGEIFGPQPYLAFKTKSGDYFHDNFDFHQPKRSFSYVFDEYTLPLDKIEAIGIGSNDKYGHTFVKILNTNL